MNEMLVPLSNAVNDIIDHKIENIVSVGLVVTPMVGDGADIIEPVLTIPQVGQILGSIYILGKIIKELLIPLIKKIIKWIK